MKNTKIIYFLLALTLSLGAINFLKAMENENSGLRRRKVIAPKKMAIPSIYEINKIIYSFNASRQTGMWPCKKTVKENRKIICTKIKDSNEYFEHGYQYLQLLFSNNIVKRSKRNLENKIFYITIKTSYESFSNSLKILNFFHNLDKNSKQKDPVLPMLLSKVSMGTAEQLDKALQKTKDMAIYYANRRKRHCTYITATALATAITTMLLQHFCCPNGLDFEAILNKI